MTRLKKSNRRAKRKSKIIADGKHWDSYGLRRNAHQIFEPTNIDRWFLTQTNMRKWFYRIVIVIGALGLLLRITDWAVRRGHSLPAPPKPNGYDELVSAAHSIKQSPRDFSELTNEQIRLLAEQNRSALERARKAFQMNSRVSVESKKDWQDRHEEELKSLKRLAVAFAVEGKSQMLGNRTNEAARCYLDVIRLAQTMSEGGILVDGINSLAVETIGSASLHGTLPQLDAAFCHEAARALEELDTRREKPEMVIATEKTWSAKHFGLIGRVGGFITRKANAKRYAEFVKRSHDIHDRTQRLMLRLAARAYELENQHLPAEVSELVPVYLKAIPRDLKTGKEIQELPLLVK